MSEEIKPKRKRKITISSAKANGRNFAKRVRDKIKDVFQLEEHQARCAVGYEQGLDIKFDPDAQNKVGIGIECKNHRVLNVFKALEQAVKNADKEKCEPALIFKKGGEKGPSTTWICIDFNYYLELRKKIMEYEQDA